jgi:parallel beta-helix repeat protein
VYKRGIRKMKREATVSFVLLVLFLVSVFPMSISLEAADSRAQIGSGSQGVETASFLPSVLPSDISLPDPPPPANLDEQLGLSLTQNFTSLAYNVTAIEQSDINGYGPAYLLNGLSSSGYWYQVGLSWDWPYLGGGFNQGFHLNYEVTNSSGSSIFPASGSGLVDFSGTVNQRDTVLRTLNFSSGNVIMSGFDFNTSASAQQSYSSQGATSFSGTPYATTNSNGFFTGLMTEWYHASEYLGNEAPVLYSESTSALSSAWMWMHEFNTTNRTQVFFDATTSPVLYTNPTQFQSFFSHGAAEYSNGYQFITGGNPETVYVMSDGSVSPSSAPISSSDNVTYAFTGNISYPTYFGIVVERSNIVIDGNGYAVQGNRSGNGLSLMSTSNVTIKNTNVEWFQNGFCLNFSSGGVVSENNASTNSQCGIWLVGSSNSNITANNIANNYYGLQLLSAPNNTVYHNNFVGNSAQASIDSTSLGNAWNDTYPSGGNYWSDYTGPDLHRGPYQNETGSDGIGDLSYFIDTSNKDLYPLMGPFSDFTVAASLHVQVVSNSTISDFQFNETAILFNVSDVNGTTGFCNIRIPTTMLNSTLTVLVNGTQVQYSILPSLSRSLRYLYFTYGHSTERVIITVPDLPDSLILAMLMLTTLLTITIHKKRHSRS